MRNLRAQFPAWALWLCTAITFLAGVLLLLAIILGVRAGQQQLEIKQRQQIGLALQRALEYHAEGQLAEAQSAYEAVLILDGDNSAALEGLAQLRRIGDVTVVEQGSPGHSTPSGPDTPVAAAVTPLLPTVTSLPPTSVAAVSELPQLMTQAETAYTAGRWAESIDLLLKIRRLDATHQTAQVDEQLFTAYINLATEKDNQNKLEEALTLYDEALAIEPDATEVRRERQLIAEYLEVLTYSGADWARATTLLRTLYTQEPDYRDVKNRLHEALLAYGEEQGGNSAWCDAAALLSEAININITPGLIAKRDQYQSACDDPTRMAASITNSTTVTSEALTETTVVTDAPGAATAVSTVNTGVTAGALGRGAILYSAIDSNSGRSRIMAQSVSSGAPATLFREDAMQPALRQDGQRLVFRNTRNDMGELSAWDPASDLLLRFTNYTEDTLPTWNPESNRIAFASNREGDRIWRIYTTWADSNSDDMSLSIGEAPDWHPFQDTIVFRGCDDTGNRCGLWTIDSAGSNRLPLTTISADNRPTWAPDGRYVLFMSDGRDGNFEIYRVDTTTEQVLRLTNAPAIDGLPTVSPDGRWVAFVSNREGGWKLWAVPLGGGATVPIAPIAGNLDNWLAHDIQWIP